MEQAIKNTNEQLIIKQLARKYNTLDYLPKLRQLIASVYPSENFANHCKFDLHRRINETILERYHGEQGIKNFLFREFSHMDLVGAFEMNVKTSRVDFLTINGHTTSFEIKSELDTLTKLAKQSSDYRLAFEYNNIVIDKRHVSKALDIIPDDFGVWTIYRGRKRILRPACVNKQLDANFQLGLLTKKELLTTFGETSNQQILSTCDQETINFKFKVALKARYASRWQFIVSRSEDILPIDVQFFFKVNIEPRNIYA